MGGGSWAAVDSGRALVRRGEVWWAEDPDAGRRPHLVLTRDSAMPVLHSVIAVPATTTVRGVPTEVPLGVEDGMPADGILLLDDLSLMPKAFFRERICVLGPERMYEVCRALAIATGCRTLDILMHTWYISLHANDHTARRRAPDPCEARRH